MSRISRLISSYGKFIAVPWRNAAPAQRVVFCVYNEQDELKLRAKLDEFELVTREAGHDWAVFDLTNTFADWFTTERYAKSYFKTPQLAHTVMPKYMAYLSKQFETTMQPHRSSENTVVTLMGVGSLFGFLKVRDLVEQLAPLVRGKLLVLFPGSYEGNNYRLLDGYDGWNYLAIPITADKDG